MTLSVINFLSVVVFNDEGFIEFLVEFISFRKSYECTFLVILVYINECWCSNVGLKSFIDYCEVSSVFSNRDNLTWLDFSTWNV